MSLRSVANESIIIHEYVGVMKEEIIADRCCGSAKTVDENSLLIAPEDLIDGTDGDQIKELVKKRYGHAAIHATGCGCATDSYETEFSFVGKKYEDRDGYVAEADLGLGCGVPTACRCRRQ